MRVLLIGGTGLIGTSVAQALVDRGDQVLCHTRKRRQDRPGIFWFTGDSQDPATYSEVMASADAVINLAGAPIAARWTRKNKQLMLKSRTETTRALVQAAQKSAHRPTVWINASAIGLYGAHPKGLCDEAAPIGEGFLAEVASAWEATALPAEGLGIRLVRLRLGAVLSAHGGMLPMFVTAAKAFVGGPMGTGAQPLSWIHITDAVRMLLWCADEPNVHGAINAVAPNPTDQNALIGYLGKILSRPMWLRSPAWALKLVMGDMAHELVLGGQEVVPKAALQGGFSWRYPHLESALHDLLARR